MAEADGHNSGTIAVSLTVTEGTPNAAGNYSPVMWVLRAADSYGESYSGSKVTGVVTINGTTIGYSYAWSSPGTQTRTLASGTINVGHSADGTKTIGFSFTFSGIPGTSNSGGASGSSSMTLTHIPPQTPTGLTIGTQTTPGSVPVSWSAAAGSTPSSYTIRADDDPAFGSPLTFTSSTPSMTLTGLEKGTTYYIDVRATNSSGSSAYTASQSVLTLAGAKRWDGTDWVAAPTFKRWNGNSWVPVTTAKRWDSTAWVNLT
ncbi:fibronectin type III domain-containing protein [Humibacter ginsenosidimutans]|uniref:Fibronectin type-III domain-containing protein n=1 Tax=Humibacter ginsenosidimutans TaxID=2599293 RepID=A0A5B8M2D9_9MICO|nr:fibronectin type III domain-containing protein [Humibacter ginsenosidimutans]QDZ14251.1 hypothetical protein FPZ11_05250 [Humibacter ginsenosidimutans]